MKADLEVMDTLIVSLSDELNKISESHWNAEAILDKLNFQYELLKKEHKQSVEAVPVKHGKWMVTPTYIKCSECGRSFMLIPQNYCPNCGARMDAE